MFNQATIMGFLGNDPAIHTFQSGAGSKSATFTVAVNESYIDRQGHKQTITTWIPCVAYGKLADIVQQITRKGSCVFVQGKLQQNKPYTNKDGVQVQSYSLVVDTIRLCGGANTNTGSTSANTNSVPPSHEVNGVGVANQHYPQSGQANLASNTYEATQQQPQVQHQVNGNNDDDIPF